MNKLYNPKDALPVIFYRSLNDGECLAVFPTEPPVTQSSFNGDIPFASDGYVVCFSNFQGYYALLSNDLINPSWLREKNLKLADPCDYSPLLRELQRHVREQDEEQLHYIHDGVIKTKLKVVKTYLDSYLYYANYVGQMINYYNNPPNKHTFRKILVKGNLNFDGGVKLYWHTIKSSFTGCGYADETTYYSPIYNLRIHDRKNFSDESRILLFKNPNIKLGGLGLAQMEVNFKGKKAYEIYRGCNWVTALVREYTVGDGFSQKQNAPVIPNIKTSIDPEDTIKMNMFTRTNLIGIRVIYDMDNNEQISIKRYCEAKTADYELTRLVQFLSNEMNNYVNDKIQ